MSSDPIYDYCGRVLAMVRWQPAHKDIADELTGHMLDHAEVLTAGGVPPEKARRDAAAAMGDPYALGGALDKLHSPWYPRLARLLCVLAVLCLCLGFYVYRNTFPLPRLVLNADPAALVLEENISFPPAVVLATGSAVGGGQIGSYRFSRSGAAALVRIDTDYDGKPLEAPEYQLRVVFSAVSWRFWLGPLRTYLLPGSARDAAGNDLALWTNFMDERGLLRRYYTAVVVVEDSALQEYTVELGGDHALVYAVTLGEEGAP